MQVEEQLWGDATDTGSSGYITPVELGKKGKEKQKLGKKERSRLKQKKQTSESSE